MGPASRSENHPSRRRQRKVLDSLVARCYSLGSMPIRTCLDLKTAVFTP